MPHAIKMEYIHMLRELRNDLITMHEKHNNELKDKKSAIIEIDKINRRYHEIGRQVLGLLHQFVGQEESTIRTLESLITIIGLDINRGESQ